MKIWRALVVLGLLSCWVLSGLNAQSLETFTARVIGISDGDTLTVLDGSNLQYKIRLAEIDAPEKKQDYGTRARQALSDLSFGKAVIVHPEKKDRYGRLVAHLEINGQNINRQMVEQGAAWVYRQYLHDQSLLEVEQHARESKLGLWGLSNEPMPPWEWRHGAKSARDERPITVTLPSLVKPAVSAKIQNCGSKRYCREMGSCAEARFYLESCGVTRLDGDHDGVPCESMCGRN